MSIMDKVKELFGGAKEKPSDATDAASGAAGSTTDEGKEGGGDLKDKATDAKDKLTGGGSDGGTPE